MKKVRLFSLLFCAALLILLTAGLFGQQKKKSLVIFPFTGGSVGEGEAIASSFNRQAVLRGAFNTVNLITRATIASKGFEQRFQRNEGLTDADIIFELGKEMGASHVIAGYITRLGDQNLVVISVMDIESLQQVAGDYQAYSSIEEINTHISDIAAKLAGAVRRDTSKLPGLSIPPFNLLENVQEQMAAMVLAQILACDLANGTRYAVLPRTDSIDKILEEHRRQQSGDVDTAGRASVLGKGRNAKYVLSGAVESLGNSNKFGADILDIVNGSTVDGNEVFYTSFGQGAVDRIAELAAKLTDAKPPAGFVRIHGGTFTMGSPDNEPERYTGEGPQHKVTLSGFFMMAHEVTQAQWKKVMGTSVKQVRDGENKTWRLPGEGNTYPMYYVSWYDAVAYCNKLSLNEGLTPAYTIDGQNVAWNRRVNGYRLPTEAEWEYACRAGTTTPFYTGSNITTGMANYDGTKPYNKNNKGIFRDTTTPVGSFAANPWGLFDMHGNVREWCWDGADDVYTNTAKTNPVSTQASTWRVQRGGSAWDEGEDLRSARRRGLVPSERRYPYGFRVVRNMQ